MTGMSSEQQLERGLQASVKIYTLAQAKLDDLADADGECAVTRKELIDVRKAAVSMNRALTALVRGSVPDLFGPCTPKHQQLVSEPFSFVYALGQGLNKFYLRHADEHYMY